jgi:hypothetical protein
MGGTVLMFTFVFVLIVAGAIVIRNAADEVSFLRIKKFLSVRGHSPVNINHRRSFTAIGFSSGSDLMQRSRCQDVCDFLDG